MERLPIGGPSGAVARGYVRPTAGGHAAGVISDHTTSAILAREQRVRLSVPFRNRHPDAPDARDLDVFGVEADAFYTRGGGNRSEMNAACPAK